MEQIEIWKNIKNSHYSISNFGRVKNDKTNYILKERKSKKIHEDSTKLSV